MSGVRARNGWQGGVNSGRFTLLLAMVLLAAGAIPPAAAVLTIQEPKTATTFQAGQVVSFSGINSESATTYLFLVGPYLNEQGVRLTNTSVRVTDDAIDSAPVGPGISWQYSWDTSAAGVDLVDGTYEVYAVTKPANKNTATGKGHDTLLINFRGQLFPATTPPTETPTPVPTWTQPPAGVEVRVSSAPTDDIPGKFDGQYLVYEAKKSTGDSDVYLYDITTGITTPVATGPAIQQSPSVSGDHVVYSAYEKMVSNQTDSDLYLYTISTGTTTRITLPGDQVNPKISGNLVAWQDEPTGHSSVNLMVQDLTSGISVKVPTRMWAYNPDISGSRVIWIDRPDGPAVFLYDLSTGTWERISNRTGIQGVPQLDRNRVTWADSRGDDQDIFVLDLATGTETQVTEGNRNQFTPSISGDRVAWIDFRNGNFDVYTYNLATASLSPVTTDPAEQSNVQVGGCIVAWSDDRYGSRDIFYKELTGCTPPPPIAQVSLTPETTVPTTTSPTTRPVTPRTTKTTVPTTAIPVPTTTSPGFGAPVILAGFGAALLLMTLRRP